MWGLTQVDGLALEVEVLQHQKGAFLEGRVHPPVHLTALEVIPGGGVTEFTFTQLGHRKLNRLMKDKKGPE